MSNRERIAALAKDTLILSRNTLLVNLRFLDCALSMLDFLLSEDGCIPGTPIPMNGGLIVTGKQIIYEPMWVLSRYRNEKEAIVRDYLHMVFHCIFHHPFVGGLMDTQRWDLACDIAVESVIDDLGISCVAAQRSRKQAALRGQIKQQVRLLSAEKIYGWLMEGGFSDEQIVQMWEPFKADEHHLWYMRKVMVQLQNGVGEVQDQPAEQEKSGHDGGSGAYTGAARAVTTSLEQEW